MVHWLGKRRFNYIDLIGLTTIGSLVDHGSYGLAAVAFIVTVALSVAAEMSAGMIQ
jgi:hypothetical protein